MEAWDVANGILISHYESINVWKSQLIWGAVPNDNLSLNITEGYHILISNLTNRNRYNGSAHIVAGLYPGLFQKIRVRSRF